jgi:protein O-GlcNAc transferase
MSDNGFLARELYRAADCVSKGNLALAEIVCRTIISHVPNCAQAYAMLGVVAAQLQLRDRSVEYLQKAISCDPALVSAQDHLRQVQRMRAREFDLPTDRNDRFLLIKAWGFGLWSDIIHVLGALLLAEISGRIPVTRWGSNSLYSIDPNADAFQAYFEAVSSVGFDALAKMKSATIFPRKWTSATLHNDNNAKVVGSFSRMGGLYFLNRPENIVVSDYFVGVVDLVPWIPQSHPLYGKSVDELLRYLIGKYIRPKPYVVEAVEEFQRIHIGETPAVALHVRGSDKYTEQADIDDVNRSYFGEIDRLDKAWKILLLTDDTRVVDIFRKAYPNRLVVPEAQRSSNEIGVHHSGNRASLGFEIMRDTYLALRCRKFIGNGQSGVSAMISILKDWKPDDCILLRPTSFYAQNAYLYHPDFQG